MFSIVNIFKILNKLFKIAFYNFPLHASKMRGTLKSHSDSPCVTEYRNSLSNEDQGPWFPVLFFFFFSFLNLPVVVWVWRLTEGWRCKVGETVDSTLYFSFSIYSLCSGPPFPSPPQWMLETVSFEELGHNIKTRSLSKICSY